MILLGYNTVYLWLFVFLIMLIIEIPTLGLTTIWFALGALTSLIMAKLGFSFIVQIIVFVVISFITLYYTRPMVSKYLKVGQHKTNVDSLIDKKALVIKSIKKYEVGQVKINGVVWSAISEDSEDIPKGVEVFVVRVEGVKLVVKRA